MTAWGSELTLAIADMVAPGFSAREIRLMLPMDGSADLHIGKLAIRQQVFRDVSVHCGQFALSSSQLVCSKGSLAALPGSNLEFSYDFDTKRILLTLAAANGEAWHLSGTLAEQAWQVSLQLKNAQASRLSAFMPDSMPRPGQGVLDGTLSLRGNASGLQQAKIDLHLADVAFGDASGLHAADKLHGELVFDARRTGMIWHWQGQVHWQSGEVYWQPLYLQGGAALVASGSYDGKLLKVEQAGIDLPDVGHIQLSASWQMMQGVLQDGVLRADKLALDKLFEVYAKPFLEKGALTDSSLQGYADVEAVYRGAALQILHLNLQDAGISDSAKRFSLQGINTDLQWLSDAPTHATVNFSGGSLLGAPLGASRLQLNMKGSQFDVQQTELPILDGKLNLSNFHLHREENPVCCSKIWQWQFSGTLAPISMEKLSAAAGWPKMLGALSGRIPEVSYDGNEISVEGALLFSVFDGTVVATGLKLTDAFGRAPGLTGNLAMRNLDLDLLTRTFSFGNMQGRLDVDVRNLQLQDWQPASFDAHLYSSAGNYPKKISQKAVQNISALGGMGAAAAIQRSYLGFFENFGYDRIGWRCVLRNGVCQMGGIEAAKQGVYAIIRGGGIPAITVMGYNRAVSWNELVTRLKRVMQNNVKPIVQ